VEEAARLALTALAHTDHDGLYGIVRFAEAAEALDVPSIFGAKLTVDLPHRPQAGAADPVRRHIVILARNGIALAQPGPGHHRRST
jgi:error-prone DNA polymerase